jgi:hypothetical protein
MQSAHAELDQLRQATAAERVKQRELEAQKDAAKLKVESAGVTSIRRPHRSSTGSSMAAPPWATTRRRWKHC